MALVEGIQFLVVGEDQMGVAADAEFGRIDPPRPKHVHLGEENPGVDHHTVANNRRDVRV